MAEIHESTNKIDLISGFFIYLNTKVNMQVFWMGMQYSPERPLSMK